MSREFGSFAAWTTGTPDTSDAPPPEVRYRAEVELGRGGMGVVLEVTDTWLDRRVALKRPLEATPEVAQRMMREAAITARLSHPGIPSVLDVGEDEQGGFYTMPLLSGRPLDEQLRTGVPLSEVVRIVMEAGRAVAHAHERGVVHRDLKPGNIVIGSRREVWVVDWGVAWRASDPDDCVVGTLGFMAPEQARGQCSAASDVYALGRTMAAALPADVDAPLRSILTRATADDPAHRYTDAGAMTDDLRRWLDEERVDAHVYSVPELALRSARRHVGLLTGLALLGTVIASSLAYSMHVQQREGARTRAALARSLVQRAAAFGRQGGRAEAETLAVESLLLTDTPAARGQLARWAAAPSPSLIQAGTMACESPVLMPSGGWYCATESKAWNADGSLHLEHNPHREWADRSQVARLVRDTVVVGPPMRTYRDGERILLAEPGLRQQLGQGPRPVFSAGMDLYTVPDDTDAPEQIASDLCENSVESLFADDTHLVVACRSGGWWWEGEGRVPFAIGEEVAQVTWQGEAIASTWTGALLFSNSPGLRLDTGGLAAVQLLPLGSDRLVVRTEAGRARVLDVPTRMWITELPRGADALAVVGERIRWTRGAEYRDFVLPSDTRTTELDLREEGGISAMAISPSGREIALGSSTGSVHVWDLRTRRATRVVHSGPHVTKGVAWGDDGELYVTNGSVFEAFSGQTYERAYMPHVFSRNSLVSVVGYGKTIRHYEPDGDRLEHLPFVRSDAFANDTSIWIIDISGGVYRVDDTLRKLFHHSGAEHITALRDEIILSEGSTLYAYGADHQLRWSRTLGDSITSLAMSAHWVATGTLHGHIVVLDRDGTERARFQPHDRRISALELRDDDLFSASWDGLVRIYGLGPLRVEAPALFVDRQAAWQIDAYALEQ